jgi:hypothetical protein
MEQNESKNKITKINNTINKIARADSLKRIKKIKENKKKINNNLNSNNSTQDDSTTNNKKTKKTKGKKVNFSNKITIIKVECWKKYNLENTCDDPYYDNLNKYKKKVYCKCIIF